ncbi:MAG: HAD family hydrolase [Bacteroidaceae bacterium]|nr:HAD family hydrolase [Bacteroidaceae bacterium]
MTVKGVLIDFGGTIDTDGRHWYKVFKQAYSCVAPAIEDALLRQAYVYAERTLGKKPIVNPQFTFYKTLETKLSLQTDFLRENGCPVTEVQSKQILDSCYAVVTTNINKVARPELESMSECCPLVLVTNFYGNMNSVLKEFGIDRYFAGIVESAVEGVRKPNPDIFRLAVNRLGVLPADTVMIGDSLSKDILPAMEVGCKTIWLKGEQWEDESVSATCSPDFTITTLRGISKLL